MEAGTRYRTARYCAALAPRLVPLGVETQIEVSAAWQTTLGRRSRGAHQADGPREPHLGGRTHAGRAAQARTASQQVLHPGGTWAPSPNADLGNLPPQPCQGDLGL